MMKGPPSPPMKRKRTQGNSNMDLQAIIMASPIGHAPSKNSKT
jgi:hypothetical protein